MKWVGLYYKTFSFLSDNTWKGNKRYKLQTRLLTFFLIFNSFPDLGKTVVSIFKCSEFYPLCSHSCFLSWCCLWFGRSVTTGHGFAMECTADDQ